MTIATILLVFVLFKADFGLNEENLYHAGLLIDGVKFCSGSLIKENFVITTAKCVHKAFEVDVILRLANLWQRTETAFICTSFIIHEDFETDRINKNIALIEIPMFDTSRYKITTLKLPTTQIHNGDKLTLSGFDLETLAGDWASQNVQVDDEQCQHYSFCVNNPTSFFGLISKNQLPEAMGYRNDGSPVTVIDPTNSNVLVGVVVFMDKEATYALRIAPLVEWIQSKLDSVEENVK